MTTSPVNSDFRRKDPCELPGWVAVPVVATGASIVFTEVAPARKAAEGARIDLVVAAGAGSRQQSDASRFPAAAVRLKKRPTTLRKIAVGAFAGTGRRNVPGVSRIP